MDFKFPMIRFKGELSRTIQILIAIQSSWSMVRKSLGRFRPDADELRGLAVQVRDL